MLLNDTRDVITKNCGERIVIVTNHNEITNGEKFSRLTHLLPTNALELTAAYFCFMTVLQLLPVLGKYFLKIKSHVAHLTYEKDASIINNTNDCGLSKM